MIFFKPFIKWKKELESKSSDKWPSDPSCEDITMGSHNKVKRLPNNKIIASSIPHNTNNENYMSCKRVNYQDDGSYTIDYNSLDLDNRYRKNIQLSVRNGEDNNNNKRDASANMIDLQERYDINLQNAYSSYSNMAYPTGHQSLMGPEDLYIADLAINTTVPTGIIPGFRPKPKNINTSIYCNENTNSHTQTTFIPRKMDTALLLQDTEALLNDMEKRVYSRKDRLDNVNKSKGYTSNIYQGEKIPYVDETDEREDSSGLFVDGADAVESGQVGFRKPQQQATHNEQINYDALSRSCVSRSPRNFGNVKRNHSCKLGTSESMNLRGKLNSTVKGQRSCSMVEEQGQHFLPYNNNNAFEYSNDYRSKSKPQGLAMNMRGISSGFNGSISKLEPSSFFNNNISFPRSKDLFPYFTTNLLSQHRQRLNRFEYGQHSLKYNSNSTTMLYSKHNNVSPPWNKEDADIGSNSFYPIYDNEYYAYNPILYPQDSPVSTFKQDQQLFTNSSQVPTYNIESDPENDFNKNDENKEFLQPCNASGRSSAFSPVNSLHQSNESINKFPVNLKSRSSFGINEQRRCSYDTLLVSSVHQCSARLCRYTEEIVHRMKRESSECQRPASVDTIFDKSDVFGQIKSVNRELQETVSNLRLLEKHLQKVERILFPCEKGGRNSSAGNCTENNYMDHLERINKELKDFVPINNSLIRSNKSVGSRLLERTEYSYLSEYDKNDKISFSSTQPVENIMAKSLNNDKQLELSKAMVKDPDIGSLSKSTYSFISKRF